MLAPGGVLAVQSPRQQEAPSHRLLRELSEALYPHLFDWSGWQDDVRGLAEYDRILSAFGELDLWETTYVQLLAPDAEAHPVRRFTEATAGRRVLDQLDAGQAEAFLTGYDAELETHYPRRSDGSVLFPFHRSFLVLRVPEA
ncbi:class I SAM-dependent methyltransferase [Mangrovicoccus ximenensis]|uniref:hypothetical protein n=1 Tax=Mangrovicoccus ximenensis TaxID=1911570 RepID=UPI001F2AF604|nr:hypothetical protein [Mangrovicoccus ximenensis]